MKYRTLLVAALLLGANVAANASPFVMTIEDEGTTIVTASGNIDLTGLVSITSVVQDTARATIDASTGMILIDPSRENVWGGTSPER
jgi:hypothetical protein